MSVVHVNKNMDKSIYNQIDKKNISYVGLDYINNEKWRNNKLNPNLELRDYTGENNLNIDGRNIPYQLFTVSHYLYAKNEDWTEEDLENFTEGNYELYQRINQVIALKQSCVLLRNTRYSCGSLSEDLFTLKSELIKELKEKYNYEFDEALMESYPSEEEFQKLNH